MINFKESNNKHKIRIHNADNWGCGQMRIKVPYIPVLEHNGLPLECISGLMEGTEIQEGIDLIILQRQYNHMIFQNTFYSQINKGSKVLYEIDDDFWTVEPINVAAYKVFYPGSPACHNIASFLKNSDLISVSTKHLKKVVSKFTDKPIVVLPNSLRFNEWDVFSKKREEYMNNKKDDKIIIGWAGSSSHVGDFSVIIEPLVSILKSIPNVYLKLVGETNLRFFKEFKDVQHKILFSEWTDPDKFGDNLVDFDIGIIPLEYNKFNMSKSNLKYLEYSIMKIPSIATDIECYNNDIIDGKNGYLIKNNKDVFWRNRLLSLINNESKRKELAENAYKLVIDNYLIENNWKLWEDALNMLIETPKNEYKDTDLLVNEGLKC